MSTKRTPINRQRQAQITAAAVEAFTRAIELEDAAEAERAANPTGSQGPIQSEHTDAWCACKRALGLRPWEISPIDVHGSPKAPRAFDNPDGWRRAQELRAALLQAAGLEAEK
jgi:hypothetical protein